MAKTAKNSARRGRSSCGWEQRAVTGITQEIHALDPLTECKYLRDFREVFSSYQCAVSAAQFEQELLKADVILVGDYHTLPAAQLYAAQLLERLAANRKSGSRSFSLGLEAIFADNQPALDAWRQNQISEQQLRLALRFDEEWGYAWEPIRELLQAARHHALPVYGLDCGPRSNLRGIRRRDRHAAMRIAEIRERFPQRALLALFGESHLAPSHLPALVRARRPQDKVLTILQNCDALYWQLAANQSGERPVVQVCDDVFCVFTASLFEKYDSYRNYLNGEENSCRLTVASPRQAGTGCQSLRRRYR